jgi:hypothetical protein
MEGRGKGRGKSSGAEARDMDGHALITLSTAFINTED